MRAWLRRLINALKPCASRHGRFWRHDWIMYEHVSRVFGAWHIEVCVEHCVRCGHEKVSLL